MAEQVLYAGAASAVDWASTSQAVDVPAGAPGDLLLLQVTVGNATESVTTPTGWELLAGPTGGSAGRHWTFGRIRAGHGSTVTVTTSGSIAKSARCYRFTNSADMHRLLETGVVYGVATASGGDASIEIPSATTTEDGALVVALLHGTNGTSAIGESTGETGGDYIEQTDYNGNDALSIQTAAKGTAGTISGGVASYATSDSWTAHVLVIKSISAVEGYVKYANVGTASATNGSAPAPALPDCLVGQVMVCVFYSRENVDGTVSITTSGWTQILNSRVGGGLVAAWSKVRAPGDAAPTLSLTNHSTGSSGDSAIAQIAVFRGVYPWAPVAEVGSVGDFASAQNIGAISGITIGRRRAVVVIGGKRDDWTSVATLSGDSLTWFEVGEPDTTSGADAGLVWNVGENPAETDATVTSKTFTVNGGASAQSLGVMFELDLDRLVVPRLVRSEAVHAAGYW